MGKYSGISAGEALAAMDREREVFISPVRYALCAAVWVLSILAVPAACLFPRAQIPLAIGVFILTIAIAALTGIFTGKFPYKLEKPRAIIDWINTIVFYACVAVFAVAFFISVTSGGLPAVTEEGYALVNGGKVVRALDESAYRFYSAARGAMLTILTAFNCIQLNFARKNRRG